MIAVMLALVLQATGPVIGNASFLAWDYTPGIEDEFRIYCAATPGVVPSVTPTATVASPTLQWAISGLAGQQHCVVTAFDSDAGAAGAESLPSAEVPFFVLPGPTNPRVVVP